MATKPGEPQSERRNETRRIGRVLDDIVMSEVFLKALEDAAEDSISLARLRDDPRAELQSRGVNIPEEATVEFVTETPFGINLSLEGASGVELTVNIGSGSREEEPGAERQQRSRDLDAQLRTLTESDAFLDTVEDALTNEGVLEELKADAKALLRRKGVRVPEDVEVEATGGSYLCFRYCYRRCWWRWCWTVCRTYCYLVYSARDACHLVEQSRLAYAAAAAHTANFYDAVTDTEAIYEWESPRLTIAFSGSESLIVGFETVQSLEDLSDPDRWSTWLAAMEDTQAYKDWFWHFVTYPTQPPWMNDDGLSQPRVHFGFLIRYLSVSKQIEEKIREYNPSVLHFTGHSLGAPLAILAASHMHTLFPGRRFSMYNFAGPRVGNYWFMRRYNDAVKDSFRVVIDGDFVCRLPFWIAGWWHVGKEHLIPKEEGQRIHIAVADYKRRMQCK